MTLEMNSIERTLRTLSFQPVDRVPVDLHNFMLTPRFMGTNDNATFFRDGEAMAEGQIRAWKRYGHDILLVENGTAALAEACGVTVEYLQGSAPVATSPAIKSLDEVEKLKVPDPYKDPLLSELLKTTRIIVDKIGSQAYIIGRADQGPFSLACEIRGMTEFLMDLAIGKEMDKVHQLLDFCRQVCERYALAQIEQGAHATSIGDSPSGPDVVSPKYYRKYAYPYVKQLVENLKKKDVTLAYHICGNATPIIEDMVSTGASILEVDQKSDQIAIKSAAKGKTTLLGPVDPSNVMANGTPEIVIEKCTEALINLSPGGGFILGPGCSLPSSTPDENIDAMIETARKFRLY
ncbi:MAG: uroporphyrinogen decarboxylase family protein [Anaerolineaceae bacterium]|nr:uroporphyrinogen decarboxylase family protein [Anaerolineaceae bacterium]